MEYYTAEQAEATFRYNDTVSFHTLQDGTEGLPLTSRGTGRGVVKEIEEIGGLPFLVVEIDGGRVAKMPAYRGVKVEHPAMDLADLTAYVGAEPHDQAAVAAFSGQPDGHAYTQDEADTIRELWSATPNFTE